jgi:hypothetical protein
MDVREAVEFIGGCLSQLRMEFTRTLAGHSPRTVELPKLSPEDEMRYRIGIGEALGRRLLEIADPAHAKNSLLVQAYRRAIPVTVHVAIGSDTIHFHPRCDGAALGETSLRDFRVLAATLAEARGSVTLNLGSAVLMPEVFLKALTVARNLGADVHRLVLFGGDLQCGLEERQGVGAAQERGEPPACRPRARRQQRVRRCSGTHARSPARHHGGRDRGISRLAHHARPATRGARGTGTSSVRRRQYSCRAISDWVSSSRIDA